MQLSLTKLPWYAQVGAFVALAVGGCGIFFYYYEMPVRADFQSRQQQLVGLRADITKGLTTAKKLPEFRAQVGELEARPVLRAVTENVMLEIQKTFDFFKATAASDRIDRIVLSGGASRVEGFAAALQERFGTTVESFDPFKKISFEASKFGVDDPANLVPQAAVAVGLALRKTGDR